MGVVFIIGLYIAASIVLFAVIYGVVDAVEGETPLSTGTYEMVAYLGLITSFLPLFFVVFLIHRYWHSRPIKSLLTYTAKFRWGFMTRAMIATFAIYAIATPILYYLDPEPLAWVANWRVYVTGLLLTLAFIPFQAAAEEIAIRGYLNQALIKYLKYPWVVFFITSLFFAWLHTSNPEAEGQMVTYMVSICGFGLLMCVLLYFEGGLESAIGVHIANNIFAFSIIGYEDPELPELALLSTGPPEISLGDSLLELSAVAVVVGIVLLWNRRAARKP